MSLKQALSGAVGLCLGATVAMGSSITITYDTNGATNPGGLLEATLIGSLQPDGNTFIVTGIEYFATFDGVPGP